MLEMQKVVDMKMDKCFNNKIMKCWKIEIGTCENIMSKKKQICRQKRRIKECADVQM